MPSYSQDRKWSDLFIPRMKEIIGPRFLEVSSFEVDTKQASDLIVMRVDGGKYIACRIRRPGYLKYKHEFTIRSHRDSGAVTELSKVYDGWADWMFYCHANSNDPDAGLACWMLIDLKSFRAQMIKYRKRIQYSTKSNGDGTHFIAFNTFSFLPNPPLLIDSSGIIEDRKCDF